ncbi:MAG: ABC transporter permease, partial [Myxococcales bacterium]|nr:ABC transporter permease [Myxococcales bacterium]
MSRAPRRVPEVPLSTAPARRPDAADATSRLEIDGPSDGAVALRGRLDREHAADLYERLRPAVREHAREGLALDLSGVERLDSVGVAALSALSRAARDAGGELRLGDCSDAARDALDLFPAAAEPDADDEKPAEGFFAAVGAGLAARVHGFASLLALAADTFYFTFAGARRTRRVRRGAVWAEILRVGVNAVPIVSLITFLIGVVVGLQSAAQLRNFGAQVYVANLITISMLREMGPLMTAILIAGRSGAAIAAEVATMQVTQEVDALRTMGLNPTRYIVVPKFVAMTVSLPALTVFAGALGIFGGYLMTLVYLDIGTEVYWTRVLHAVALDDVLLGFLKSVAFAWIIVVL